MLCYLHLTQQLSWPFTFNACKTKIKKSFIIFIIDAITNTIIIIFISTATNISITLQETQPATPESPLPILQLESATPQTQQPTLQSFQLSSLSLSFLHLHHQCLLYHLYHL